MGWREDFKRQHGHWPGESPPPKVAAPPKAAAVATPAPPAAEAPPAPAEPSPMTPQPVHDAAGAIAPGVAPMRPPMPSYRDSPLPPGEGPPPAQVEIIPVGNNRPPNVKAHGFRVVHVREDDGQEMIEVAPGRVVSTKAARSLGFIQ